MIRFSITAHSEATQRVVVTHLIILIHGQMTRMASKLESSSQNFHSMPRKDFEPCHISRASSPVHGWLSRALGHETSPLKHRSLVHKYDLLVTPDLPYDKGNNSYKIFVISITFVLVTIS
ncbi:hypothetical protein TNCV_5124401 [Trichonephila clavipes]|nr:hypothetical protein TNCV_5124401 [Trichonephila clavipes]